MVPQVPLMQKVVLYLKGTVTPKGIVGPKAEFYYEQYDLKNVCSHHKQDYMIFVLLF